MTKGSGRKLGYSAGDFFVVPLRNGRFATGLVARIAPGGRVVLGYFFGPSQARPATVEVVRRYRPSDAVMVAKFGDLSLQGGEWPLIGRVDWNPEEWRMPVFGRISGELAWRVEYPDENPLAVPREIRCSPEEVASFPSDNVLGSGAVEIKLGKLLHEL